MKFRNIITEVIFIKTGYQSIRMIRYSMPALIKLRHEMKSHTLFILLDILQFTIPISIRISWNTLGLLSEQMWIIGKTAFNDSLIGKLEKPEYQHVPPPHQRHKLIVMYLNNIISTYLMKIADYFPQHHKPAPSSITLHITAQVDVTRRVVPIIAVGHQRYLMSKFY